MLACNDNKSTSLQKILEKKITELPAAENDEYTSLITQGKQIGIPKGMLKDIPYFETLFSGRFNVERNGNGIITTEEFDPVLLKVILRYLEAKKKYILFACLPKDKSFSELMEMFRYLALEVPIDTKLTTIKEMLLRPPSIGVTSQSELIDYSFGLFYAKGQIDWKRSQKMRNMIYNTVVYVFQNNDMCFKPRGRYHFKNLVLSCVTLSYNQYIKVSKLEVTDNLDDSDTDSSVSSCDTCYDSSDDDDWLGIFMMNGLMDSLDFDFCPYNMWYDSDYFLDSDTESNLSQESDDNW